MTKLELIRQRKCLDGSIQKFVSTSFCFIISYENFISAQAIVGGGLIMSKKNRQNKKQMETEKKVGYGDKKLVGENRPAE